ncbi:alpha-amylase [Lacrimispora sp. NSJ-141]|uniref:Alpha-amylase n=1 Tax=Lientehia hominis TaxID=2897778 RepID=A0AAP2W6V6_9FIRM|nr:alpha-amylase [Lientehia hominis]MCD2491698.1 alpha-amylase [Lientehia hominis]
MDKIQVETSWVRPLPLGAQTENGRVHVAFTSETEGTARIHLYKKGREKETKSFVFPEENRMGDVRYIAMSGFRPEEYEYSLSVDGKPVRDMCARLVAGRSRWGTQAETGAPVRYGFLTEGFDWGQDKRPGYPFEDTILYRLHVRGFTKHSSSGVRHKGTFEGILEKIPYLKELGVTMVELQLPDEFTELPAAQSCSGPFDSGKAEGKLNYWGYGPAYCFAPKAAYGLPENAAGGVDIQFKRLVKALHENGLELSVELYFEPDAGTPYLLECLRHWVQEYHVDGIHIGGRFDARSVSEDPSLRGVKLFAGGWDGACPAGKRYLADYRDDFLKDMRKFIKGDEDQLRPLIFHMKENGGVRGKVNFLANTDGLTMMDMVSYDRKHNEANGENGKDGTDYNYSWNCGVEGPTKKRRILELRKRQLRNGWVLLMLAQGMPLILAGDEWGNSQDGNNNAYCQDNAVGWVNWKKGRLNEDIYQFARYMIQFRKRHPMLHKTGGLRSMDYLGAGCPDFSVHGEAPWYPQFENYRRQMGFLYSGKYAEGSEDEDIYVILNMHWESHVFSLPHTGGLWHLAVHTAKEEINGFFLEPHVLEEQDSFKLEPRSIAVFVSKRSSRPEDEAGRRHSRDWEKAGK